MKKAKKKQVLYENTIILIMLNLGFARQESKYVGTIHPICGHSGSQKRLDTIKQKIWWRAGHAAEKQQIH